MNNNKFGTNTGNLWKFLNSKTGAVELKNLKKISNLHEEDLYLALDWLERQNKIKVTRGKNKIFVKTK